MNRRDKGKQIAGNGSSTGGKKRKGGIEFRDEGLRTSKRKNPEVLQFFEESAEVGYFGGSSDEDEEFLDFLNDMEDDEPGVETSGKGDKGNKADSSFVFPKEEDINEEEFDKIMEERYKPGSGFFRYADDDVKVSIEMDALIPTAKDPPLWKVKCAIGRERHSVFCLMHKFVELRKIGTKLQIISVFSMEHVKGFIFIEADKEQDLFEACKGLTGIYSTRMVLVPKAEAPNLLSIQRKSKNSSEGKWARVKNGKYKGDLAQVVAVSDKKALIKLIPRIDLQALTQKYGGGVPVQKGLTPAPRLISSSELEEFRPLIQVRRDRDTGLTFEHLDSLMLKDGYLYKKVSLDSLSSWGVMPSKEEILKFTPVERKETGDEEWISEIYGEEKKKKIRITGKGGGKGDSSSGSKSESSYELYNLVCFSRKDFGLIVGVDEKGDGYKVLKEGSDGPVVVTVGKKEMLNGPFESKFTALDMNNKQISINDVVKISKGLSEGKQGVARQIYRGVIFLYDESEEENGGYFCCKSQSCEKVKLFTEESSEKTGGFDASAFGDFASSPKSPLSPEKEWQPREKYTNSNQGDKGSMYSIGQKLRIRVGPLKGYLCRVIALRYSDVTVKLDSQHKVFTVKSEHLAEVRERNTVLSTGGDAGTGCFQPFDMLGTDGSSGDWAKGAGTSGGASSDWSSWGSKPTSDSQQQTVPDNTSTWATAAAENKSASVGDQPGGWNSWGKTPASEAGTVGAWGKQGASTSNVDDGGLILGEKKDGSSGWNKSAEADGGSSWSKQDGGASWGKKDAGGSSWGKKDDCVKDDGAWGKKDDSGSTWGKKDDSGSTWGKKDGGVSSWGRKDDGNKDEGGSSWGQKNDGNKDDGGSSWGKKNDGNKDDGGSSWGQKNDGNKDDGGSSWGQKNDGGSSWGKKDDGGSSLVKKDDGGSSWGKKDDGGSSWGKNADGGSSWGKKDDGGSSWGKKDGDKDDGGSSWGKKDDGGSWGKKDDGGSSWGKQDDGGSSWGKKDTGGSSWGKNDGGYSEQTFDRGGRGYGGRRGGGRRGGRDQFGRGRSFGNSEDSAPWNKPGGGSSWGNLESGGGGSSWGKQNDAGGGSSWGKQESGGGVSSWSKQNDAGGGSSWGKQESGGGVSSWSKQNDAGGRSSWGKQESGGGGSSWSKNNDTGGGSSWGKQTDTGGGSSWNQQGSGGGGSSWSKNDDGGSKPWNEQSSGGRGFGGRRGGGFRGGFRGGRNPSGRGGRSFNDDQSSTWKPNNQENTWKSDQSGGGSDWKKGWGGDDSNFKKPSGSSSGGGNWSSWDTKKKETNVGDDKPGNDSKSAWGTDNDQAKTGNNTDGWNKKPNDDVKTNVETSDNAWGAKTDTGASSTSGSAWGTDSVQAITGNNNDGWNKKPNDNAWGAKTDAGASSTSGSAWGTGDKKSGW